MNKILFLLSMEFDVKERVLPELSPREPQLNLSMEPPSYRTRAQLFSRDQLFATPWIVAPQAHLSTRFSKQKYWSGLPLPPPRDLPDQGSSWPRDRTRASCDPALAGRFFTTKPPGKPPKGHTRSPKKVREKSQGNNEKKAEKEVNSPPISQHWGGWNCHKTLVNVKDDDQSQQNKIFKQ